MKEKDRPSKPPCYTQECQKMNAGQISQCWREKELSPLLRVLCYRLLSRKFVLSRGEITPSRKEEEEEDISPTPGVGIY